MSSWVRWTVRIVMVGVGLVFGTYWVVRAIGSASELSDATDEAARRALQLAVAGQVLMSMGLVGLYSSMAISFRDWTSWGRPRMEHTWVPDGRQGRRRVEWQINGVEPYGADEVPYLRRLAEDRIAMRRWSPATWLGLISVSLFLAGYVLAQPGISTDAAAVSVQVFRIFVAVMLLVTVAVAAVVWRSRNDVKAQAFLQRTQAAPWPTDGSR